MSVIEILSQDQTPNKMQTFFESISIGVFKSPGNSSNLTTITNYELKLRKDTEIRTALSISKLSKDATHCTGFRITGVSLNVVKMTW